MIKNLALTWPICFLLIFTTETPIMEFILFFSPAPPQTSSSIFLFLFSRPSTYISFAVSQDQQHKHLEDPPFTWLEREWIWTQLLRSNRKNIWPYKKHLLCEGATTADALLGTSTTQSYDLMCIVPKRSLLKTVIPGWLWSGRTPDGGKQKMPICNKRKFSQTPTKTHYMKSTNFGLRFLKITKAFQ